MDTMVKVARRVKVARVVKVARRAKVARNGLTARHPTAHHPTARHPTAHHLTSRHPTVPHLPASHLTALLLMLFLPLLIWRNFSYRLTKTKKSWRKMLISRCSSCSRILRL